MHKKAKTKEKFLVVGLGEILWDLMPEGRRLGGAPANFAYHCHSLGADGIIVSAVGQDKDGREISSSLDALEIKTTYLEKNADYPTGTVSVDLDEFGQASYTIHSPVAWDYISWSQSLASLAMRCDAVCFGSLAQRNSVSRESIQRFLETAPENCLRVFDVNIRQDYATEDIVRQSLKLANVLKLNDDELPIVVKMLGISGTSESEIVTELIKACDLHSVILTKGAAGSAIYTKDDVSFCESQDVPIVDTVGAGDSFTAATVMGFLHKMPLNELHQGVSRIADYVCTQPGATPSLDPDLALF